MIARRPSCGALAALASAIAVIGCSQQLDNLPREPVAGTVTMDGRPMSEAIIQFYPTGDAAKTAPGVNAEIKEGQFSIPRAEGPVPGSYKVSISHAEAKDIPEKGKVAPSIPSRRKKLGPELVPAKYNSKSELKAEIKPGGNPDLKFDLQSK